ncbi:hypothetical protein ACIBQ1_03545 [Nonomuraea sp. NPDC050153]|uniref:hypothetical protein n=1 Tax=Nonomuraea sp. NPDC050153 TaxID=3364359 RepID=UPI0037957014
MTIPPLTLDDLTWARMTEAIRARIPSASLGQWTLHAPVDPGVALLELYAWLLEQRLYLLDQVPDTLVRGVLRLLGITDPAPAVPAATVLALASGAAPGALPPAVVPAGTELVHALGTQRLVFTTDDDVALVPGSWQLLADGFPWELELTVPGGFAPPAGARIGLLLLLDTGERIPPSWAPDAPAGVPPPATVTWSYESAPGRFEPARVDDGTGGLRRSGVVRLIWPDDWQPGAATVVRRLRLSIDRPGFSAPPRLLRLTVNAVVARHCQAVTATGDLLDRLAGQTEGWLSLPGQVLDLNAAGRLLDDPGSVHLTLMESDGAEHPWTATAELAFHGPADRVFVIDRDAGCLRFGDGLTGRLPVIADPPRLRLDYQLGGGPDGNVGPVTWTCPTLPLIATSAVPARFGRPPETIAEARGRAAAELARPVRAVTVPDIEQIVLATPGVDIARADVAVGLHPATPCDSVPGAVTVVIVPGVPAGVPAPMPDPGAVAAVTAALEAARLICTEIFVRGPRYRPVELAVALASAVADPAGLRERLTQGLGRYLDPLIGGPGGTGWIFGEPLRPTELLGVAQDVAGRSAVIGGVSIGLDSRPPGENCQDVAIGPHDLVVLTGLTVAAPGPAAPGEGLS